MDSSTPSDQNPHPAFARELTALFERHLVRCKFAGASPIPPAGRPSDFLSIVEAAGDHMQGAWGAASRFFRLLAPISAYHVRCTILPGVPTAPDVLHVEMSRLPRTSVAPVVVRERSAERAVEVAAHAVAALVLPRTRQCTIAPWSLWQDRRLPYGLYDAHQRFQALRAARHFDEAMAALRSAVRLDPGNLALRLELGKLQERMQMYLDALLTYDDIITVAARRDPRLWEWWNPEGANDGGPSWNDSDDSPGLRPDDPVIFIARYRHAQLLGVSENIAGQWWGRPERCAVHQSSRERRRAYLREALAVRLTRRYAYVVHTEAWSPTRPPTRARPYFLEGLGEVTDAKERDKRTAAARIFFTTPSDPFRVRGPSRGIGSRRFQYDRDQRRFVGERTRSPCQVTESAA